MRFSDLTPGYEFPATAIALDAETVARYLSATEDDNDLYWRDGAIAVVPPLAVAALSFRGIAQELALEPGSLHTGQELAFRRPVSVGERLTTQAVVTASSKRRGFTVLMIDLAAVDDAGEVALSGRMTLMVAGVEAGGNGGSIATPPSRGDGDMAGEIPAVTPVAYPPLGAAEIVAGRDLGSLTRTVTQQRIDQYAVASGDYNPIHVDPAFAAHSPFGGTVAHGMLQLAYLSSLLARAFGLAWPDTGTLKVKFRNPAPAGTTLTARGQVEQLEAGHGVQYALCAVRLENADGDVLITGDARVDVK